MQNFSELAIPQPLFHRLEQIGFSTPTEIQAQAIPHALKGHDILGSAQTGTGKTGAFGIPLITHLMSNDKGKALILLPTRELAAQVGKALKQFIGKSKIGTALLIGGDDINKQFRQLKASPRIIIGTPGRINDHLSRKSLKLSDVDFLILDEVDRMLDMGFGVQLDEISKYLTGKRQTLMFSATMPRNIEMLSEKYLTDPIRISVGSTNKPAQNIKQEQIKLIDSEKYPRLVEEVSSREGSIIVFVKTKRSADNMANKLRKLNHKVDALHGDLRQNKRSKVIEGFRKENYRILVATDIAARGLDIPHIAHVINYDLPQSPEDYIHRIGRTARAGSDGTAVNFLSPTDGVKWNAIQRLLDPNFKPAKGERLEKKPNDRRRKPKGGSFKFGSKKPSGSKKPGSWRGNKSGGKRTAA